jgi:hypothetical protein
MKRLILLGFIAASLPASAAAAEPTSFSLTLPAGEAHEECMHLNLNDWGRYEWKSDEPLDFNIHYHRGTAVHYPVKKPATKAQQGTFVAKSGDDYCWMWSAGKKPAKLEGTIKPG